MKYFKKMSEKQSFPLENESHFFKILNIFPKGGNDYGTKKAFSTGNGRHNACWLW